MCASGRGRAVGRASNRFSLQHRLRQRDDLLSVVAGGAFQLLEQSVEIGSILAQRAALQCSQRLFHDIVLGEADNRVVEQKQFGMIEVVRRDRPRSGNSRVVHESSPSESE